PPPFHTPGTSRRVSETVDNTKCRNRQRGLEVSIRVTMAKWFKEFPMNLKNGTDRIRGGGGVGGGVGSLLSGRNRKNSAIELSRNGVSSPKDGKVWDNLLSGKSRKNSKAEPVFDEQPRSIKSSPSANAYISRLIRVDKQDKSPSFNSGTITSAVAPEAEKAAQCKTETVIILEDYADPFDAQKTREQREAERVGENDGYMEPYDAQQMITEIRRRGSKDLLKVCAVMEGSEATADEAHPAPVQIYDIPYEEGGDSEKTAITRPELDTRPSTEYELPWEWKKEHIVKTLSGTVEFIHVFSYYTQHQHQHRRQKSWTQKILRSSLCIVPHRKVVPERGFPYSQGGIVDIESRLISLCIIVWCNSPLPTILCLSLTPFQVYLCEASSLSGPLKSCLSLKCLNRKHCKHVAF
uniref:Src homology 2 domain containing E n=1 Tax=Astatotilapia calliptera TaxID=8154 RepID=A0AAX7VB86_ASTCA